MSMLIYLDDQILAINKPPGLAVLSGGWDPAAAHVRSLLEPEYGRLWIVHRLDRGTSGVLLLARTAAAHRSLNDQFAGRQVEKRYHALVHGIPSWSQHETHLPLRLNVGHSHRTVPDPRGVQPAHTAFHLLERLGTCSLLEAIPHTGRTHQIRAHLYALGLPLLADPLYGGGPPPPGAPALSHPALHAVSLAFTHPASGAPLEIQAPYPEDFSALLAFLRANA